MKTAQVTLCLVLCLSLAFAAQTTLRQEDSDNSTAPAGNKNVFQEWLDTWASFPGFLAQQDSSSKPKIGQEVFKQTIGAFEQFAAQA